MEKLHGRQQNLHLFSIQVISLVDRYWVECALELRQGVVPSANVAPVLLPPLQPGQQVLPAGTLFGTFLSAQVCIVRADLPARHPGDIGLARGIIFLRLSSERSND